MMNYYSTIVTAVVAYKKNRERERRRITLKSNLQPFGPTYGESGPRRDWNLYQGRRPVGRYSAANWQRSLARSRELPTPDNPADKEPRLLERRFLRRRLFVQRSTPRWYAVTAR